jgi:predicted transcriptional regulator
MEDLKMNKKELMEQLETGDYGDQFTNYSDGYIGDIISEIADRNIDIYYSDLWDWAKNNYEWCEEAIAQGLYEVTSSREFDIHELFQAGQYEQYTHDLYENLDDSIKYFIYHNLELEEINEELQDFIDDLCDDVDNNKKIEDVLYEVNAFIENMGNQEEIDEE